MKSICCCVTRLFPSTFSAALMPEVDSPFNNPLTFKIIDLSICLKPIATKNVIRIVITKINSL